MVKSAAAPITNPIVGASAVPAPASVSSAAPVAGADLPADVKRAVDKYTAAMNKRVDMSEQSRASAIQKYTDRMIKLMPVMMQQ